MCARKATWLAFGLVALATVSRSASVSEEPSAVNIPHTEPSPTTTEATIIPLVTQNAGDTGSDAATTNPRFDQATEAARAYRQAMSTLATLTAHPPAHTFDPSLVYGTPNTKSLFSSFLPNIHGQGPIGSALRIAVKVHHYTIRRIVNGFGKEGLGIGSRRKEDDMRGKAIKVVDLLEHSAELGNMDALYTLAHVSLFPPTRHFVPNPTEAFHGFSNHARETGNATSQAYVAFFYSTGYHGVVPVDQAKAQLFYTFAANGGERGAQMALGYRYWSGIGTQESCERASIWYESASEQVIAKFMSGPPGGRTLPQTATRLSDLVGGVFGPGASVASTGFNAQRPAIKAGMARDAGETWEDVLEYYLFNADRGETDFAYRLGKIFYQGSIYGCPGGIASGSEGVGAVPRNYAHARHYFLQIARQVWPRDPANPLHYKPTPLKDDHGPVGYAAASAGYLGRMYLRGEGVKADPAIAKMWFERGVEHGDRECQNGLGLIHRDGLVPGIKADVKKALKYFAAASGQELAEAQVNLGKYHYARGELTLATTYLEAAVRHGSPLEAYYYLGEIAAAQAALPGVPPHVVSSSCAMAVSFHKLVAERGSWDEDLLRDAEIAWMSASEHGKETAMLKWWIAAEKGSEIAQNNLAYVLDQDKSILRLTRFSPMTPSNDTARLALTQWTRAATQRNIDALVKVGDYYYHGLGVPEEEASTRFEKAARYYQSAADTQMSALAMWNLGWMYENGIGVPQDFHLAKRHYDLALETNSEAYLPILLSLGKLYLRSIWHTLMGGKGGLNIWNPEEENDSPPSKPTEGRELEGKREDVVGDKKPRKDEGREYLEDEEGPWYLGKAKEDFRKRRNGQLSKRPTEEEDPIQWARDRRNAEQERDSDFGPEDYFEGATRGGNREDTELDDLTETFVLVFLCLLISVLLYMRTRIVDRIRRDQQEGGQQDQQAQPQANGMFPPPGDPARNEWAILR
ncbi:Protein sel-1 1 [Hypsizygus marmoreus]|uniref:Protein sel-1 1 n=1 Tax=Hypsizygus marmoreus TaxID=39966 RepID=A0A369JWK3_HYPMA|nr:Protein sel-1 1 [Hypsizygus marmoreus]